MKNSGLQKNTKIILNNDNDDKRMLFENCRLQSKRVVNPIVDWTENDVWAFLTNECGNNVNPLYSEGWCRVGCVGCPLASPKLREEEFIRWPRYRRLYLQAFDKMLENRYRLGKMEGYMRMGTTPKDVFNWWIDNGILPGQIDLFDESEDL